MKPIITKKMDWVKIETEDSPYNPFYIEEDYFEKEDYSKECHFTKIEGYGARMENEETGHGTDWDVSETYQEAVEYLSDNFDVFFLDKSSDRS